MRLLVATPHEKHVVWTNFRGEYSLSNRWILFRKSACGFLICSLKDADAYRMFVLSSTNKDHYPGG